MGVEVAQRQPAIADGVVKREYKEATPHHMIQRLLSVFSALITIAVVLRVLVRWKDLPAEIPVHFSISGEPNAYGPKIILGIIAASVIAVYFFLDKLPMRSREDTPISRLGLKASVLMSLGVVVYAMSCLADEPCIRGHLLLIGAAAPPVVAVFLIKIFRN